MSSLNFRTALVATLLLGLMAATGCLAPLAVGAAAGIGAIKYADGDLNGVAYANVDRTWRATLRTMDEMGLSVEQQRKEVTRAHLRAQQAPPDRTDIRINLERRGGDFTRITIRVGLLGDEAKSRDILEAIKANL